MRTGFASSDRRPGNPDLGAIRLTLSSASESRVRGTVTDTFTSPHDRDRGAESLLADVERAANERGDARVFVRGVAEPYCGPQHFFDDIIDRSDVTTDELVQLHDAFERRRPTESSIFDLFESRSFQASLELDDSDGSAPAHPRHLHVFQSEDSDSVPQATWVHSRDLLVIEVPTRLWEIHHLSLKAVLDLHERNERARATKGSRKRTRRRV